MAPADPVDTMKDDRYADLFQEMTGETGFEEKAETTKIIDTSAAEGGDLPTAKARCSNCDNGTAYWAIQQNRSASNPETRFFICTKCDHRWREDDH